MRLIYGVGYNSQREHKVKSLGKNVKSYDTWKSMIQRCYDPVIHEKFPTYTTCTVDPRWHDYQDFADWFVSHPYSEIGYQLDKDLLVKGNKIYSPETCCFVPKDLNTILSDRANDRGDYPVGVTINKLSGRFTSRINIEGKRKHLGVFICPNEAYQVYKIAKEAHVKSKTNEYRDRVAPEVYEALMAWRL